MQRDCRYSFRYTVNVVLRVSQSGRGFYQLPGNTPQWNMDCEDPRQDFRWYALYVYGMAMVIVARTALTGALCAVTRILEPKDLFLLR